VTSNDGKFKEIYHQMAEQGYSLERVKLAYPELQADTIQETIGPGLQWVMAKLNRPVMIDDTGLIVDALKGFPGVYSSYVFKTIGCEGILRLMEGVKNRGARFECCIGFMVPGGRPYIAKGVARGTITTERIGECGFGYDSIFVPEEHTKTYAQLDVAEKNKISHRGRAVETLLKDLPRLLPQS
jgi:XTP/dITP diphosphohydrolase